LDVAVLVLAMMMVGLPLVRVGKGERRDSLSEEEKKESAAHQ